MEDLFIVCFGNARIARVKDRLTQVPPSCHRSRLMDNAGKLGHVLEGLRGEDTVAELCRREGISESVYYRWSKEFL